MIKRLLHRDAQRTTEFRGEPLCATSRFLRALRNSFSSFHSKGSGATRNPNRSLTCHSEGSGATRNPNVIKSHQTIRKENQLNIKRSSLMYNENGLKIMRFLTANPQGIPTGVRNDNKCHTEGITVMRPTSVRCRNPLFNTLILAFSLIIFSSPFNTHATDAVSLMQTANNAYDAGLYDSALNVYHLIEKEKLESSALYYNMGNAYFKNDDIASAILYYEKSKKIDPNNEDIDYNLSIANSMIVDKIEKVPELFFKNWWTYFYNMFNADIWTTLSLFSWFILVFFIGLFILTKRRSVRKLAFYFGVIFLFTSIATFGLASQKYYYGKEQKEAIIFTPTITVKSSPTTSAVDLFVVHEGTKVRIMDEVNEWIKIKIQDGSIGWLPSSSLKDI